MNTAINFVNTALKWKGRKESDSSHKEIIDVYNSHKPLARGYKVKYTDSWCATFVSAVAINSNCADIVPLECSCSKMLEKAKKMGIWVETDSYNPKIGDLVLYDWDDSGKGDNKGYPEHIGIVVNTDGKKLSVLEGNYSNSVKIRTINVNGKNIRGFICPKFAKSTTTTTTTTKKNYRDYALVSVDVIDGKYGDGSTRESKLKKDGYDATKVQKIVNALLS